MLRSAVCVPGTESIDGREAAPADDAGRHGRGHRRSPRRQVGAGDFVVFVNDLVGRISAECTRKVFDVVQQHDNNDVRRLAGIFGACRGLQHVLGHRHTRAQVFISATTRDGV
jgi:hypothetical protein